MTHPLFQDNEARDALVADSREYIRQKVIHEDRKRHVKTVVLENQLSEYNQQQQQAVDRAMVQV